MSFWFDRFYGVCYDARGPVVAWTVSVYPTRRENAIPVRRRPALGRITVFSTTLATRDAWTQLAEEGVDYLQIVAASNFKQRSRMSMLYYHAELRNYAVMGTPNKNEHDQGFFVRWGDGGYDIAPIRHLYKTQVYQLAEVLDVPAEIRQATPSTDTYSAHSSQQEFFFRLPFEVMDMLLYALEHQVPVGEVARVMDLTEPQVQRALDDLIRKQRATEYLRALPIEYTEYGSFQA